MKDLCCSGEINPNATSWKINWVSWNAKGRVNKRVPWMPLQYVYYSLAWLHPRHSVANLLNLDEIKQPRFSQHIYFCHPWLVLFIVARELSSIFQNISNEAKRNENLLSVETCKLNRFPYGFRLISRPFCWFFYDYHLNEYYFNRTGWWRIMKK